MTQARGDNVIETYRELMASDGWLEIRARERAAKSTKEWIESLSPTEYERAWYRELIEYHDLRTQFFQYQSGYLDPRIWETSSRSQARRHLERRPYFRFDVSDADNDFYEFLNNVAQESGLSAIQLPE